VTRESPRVCPHIDPPPAQVTALWYRPRRNRKREAPHGQRNRTTPARNAAGAPAGHASRCGKREPSFAARRRVGVDAAPGRSRLGADPPEHHHRLQRIAARVRDRRARERAGRARGAHADPPVHLPRAAGRARRDALGFEHAVRAADRRDDSDRALWLIERGPRKECVPDGPEPPLRAPHADDLGHSLQLVAARRHERRVLRIDPQLPAPLVSAALFVRRVASLVFELRRRPRARPAAAEGRAAHAARHVACAWAGSVIRAMRRPRSQ